MYECPNCTHEQLHQIYTCMSCGHVVKEYEMPYQICAEPECDANTEGNRPFCGDHTTARCKCGKVMNDKEREAGGICLECYWIAIDGAQVHEDRLDQARQLRIEAQELAEQESGYRDGKGV